MRRSLKITLIIVAVFVSILFVIALLIPPIAKNYIEKHDKELIGRSIRMERLRFNILSGRLRIENLRIGGAGDTTEFFRLDSFDMRIRLLPLLAHRVDIRHIAFGRPDLRIFQRGNHFSFDDIIEHFNASQESADSLSVADTTSVEPSRPWEIGIYNIGIRQGHIYYKDLLLDAPWGLNDINLFIPGVYFAGASTDVGAVLKFAEGGSLKTRVAYDIATSNFDIQLGLQSLSLESLLPYLRQYLNLSRVDGSLSANIRLKGDTEHLLALHTEGDASLSGFKLHDMQERPVIGVDTLSIRLANGDLGQKLFLFDKVYIGGFSSFMELTSNGNNLLTLIKSDTTATAVVTADPLQNEVKEKSPENVPEVADSVATDAGFTLRVADFEIANSEIVFRDETLHKPFEYRLSDIRMRSRNFDPQSNNNLVLNARMQKTGTARFRWVGSLADLNNHNISLSLSNVALNDFSPYCEQYTAYPLTQGNLTFRSQNVIRNRNLDGTNHLDIFEPKVDKKRKDIDPEMNIPLKLGLYVLKDKKGHVLMDLPVKGSLDSPEFSYRKIVMKAIGNVLLKVVTAPFSFLSGGNKDLEYINIEPQQYTFTSEQYAALDKIAQMLQDKPDMQIALTQRIDLQKALPQQAGDALRMAYATYRREGGVSSPKADTLQRSTTDSLSSTTAQPARRRARMSMLEYEKLLQLDIRTPEINAYADSLLQLRGVSTQGLSSTEKAITLFGDQATQQLYRMMDMRDKTITDYMRTTHQLENPRFRIAPLDSVATKSYSGQNRYTISVEVDGERIEVGATPVVGENSPQTNSADSLAITPSMKP